MTFVVVQLISLRSDTLTLLKSHYTNETSLRVLRNKIKKNKTAALERDGRFQIAPEA